MKKAAFGAAPDIPMHMKGVTEAGFIVGAIMVFDTPFVNRISLGFDHHATSSFSYYYRQDREKT
jgi:hypothetical protein